eukprot:CFRG6872T1
MRNPPSRARSLTTSATDRYAKRDAAASSEGKLSPPPRRTVCLNVLNVEAAGPPRFSTMDAVSKGGALVRLEDIMSPKAVSTTDDRVCTKRKSVLKGPLYNSSGISSPGTSYSSYTSQNRVWESQSETQKKLHCKKSGVTNLDVDRQDWDWDDYVSVSTRLFWFYILPIGILFIVPLSVIFSLVARMTGFWFGISEEYANIPTYLCESVLSVAYIVFAYQSRTASLRFTDYYQAVRFFWFMVISYTTATAVQFLPLCNDKAWAIIFYYFVVLLITSVCAVDVFAGVLYAIHYKHEGKLVEPGLHGRSDDEQPFPLESLSDTLSGQITKENDSTIVLPHNDIREPNSCPIVV